MSPPLPSSNHIDWGDRNFWCAAAVIAFNPLFWNTVGRWEHRTRILTRTIGSPLRGCYALVFTILLLGILRGVMFEKAVLNQPQISEFATPVVKVIAAVLMASGFVLVMSSFWALGITGTFLGDYFGILMEGRVTSFPFNLVENPMYWGTTASYLGHALWFGSPIGIVLSAVIGICYKIALRFEGPFTNMIYQEKARTKED